MAEATKVTAVHRKHEGERKSMHDRHVHAHSAMHSRHDNERHQMHQRQEAEMMNQAAASVQGEALEASTPGGAETVS